MYIINNKFEAFYDIKPISQRFYLQTILDLLFFFNYFNIVVYKQYFVGTFPKPSMMFKCILSHLLLHIVLTCTITYKYPMFSKRFEILISQEQLIGLVRRVNHGKVFRVEDGKLLSPMFRSKQFQPQERVFRILGVIGFENVVCEENKQDDVLLQVRAHI